VTDYFLETDTRMVGFLSVRNNPDGDATAWEGHRPLIVADFRPPNRRTRYPLCEAGKPTPCSAGAHWKLAGLVQWGPGHYFGRTVMAVGGAAVQSGAMRRTGFSTKLTRTVRFPRAPGPGRSPAARQGWGQRLIEYGLQRSPTTKRFHHASNLFPADVCVHGAVVRGRARFGEKTPAAASTATIPGVCGLGGRSPRRTPARSPSASCGEGAELTANIADAILDRLVQNAHRACRRPLQLTAHGRCGRGTRSGVEQVRHPRRALEWDSRYLAQNEVTARS